MLKRKVGVGRGQEEWKGKRVYCTWSTAECDPKPLILYAENVCRIEWLWIGSRMRGSGDRSCYWMVTNISHFIVVVCEKNSSIE